MASDSISLARRDGLVEIERKAAKLWEEEQVFKAEARKEAGEKFFSSFPMPYMNDHLHMGHALSLSKADFACAYRRLRGANVLLPFAFHCSGNSIFESADRNTREHSEEYRIVLEKLAAGVKREEIRYSELPAWEVSRQNCANLRQLRDPFLYGAALGSTRYSQLKLTVLVDEPQEYLLIKIEVVKPFSVKLAPLEGKNVFLAATTPSPMFGKQSVRVSPDGKYGAYEINETDVFILTHRAADNLAYQNFSKIPRESSWLLDLTGYDLIGLPLRSPLAVDKIIYALPSRTILANKGTGIVTRGPNDAPSDEEIMLLIKDKLIESAEAVCRGQNPPSPGCPTAIFLILP
ncbi:unnamed protein product [Microthlaspi erraticum]|uniref:leucine--tRNA ligase n=1 Tax=Microthlaspi erraticum TaxID=1685480 RepID=A0A6D2JG33_9BRAS|nr:unnamed protein product [Microthlaspi erraticum]